MRLAALAQRVGAQRETLGLSQEAVAVRCGVHWTFLGQLERGQRNLSFHTLLKVAHGLGIDTAKLVRGLQPPLGCDGIGRPGPPSGRSHDPHSQTPDHRAEGDPARRHLGVRQSSSHLRMRLRTCQA